MTKEVRAGTTFTQDGNATDLKVDQTAPVMDNSQQPQVLIEPGSDEGGFTHSQAEPSIPGATKAPKVNASAATTKTQKQVKANGAPADPMVDEQLPPKVKLAEIPNEVDPSVGYLEKEA